ncbi:hypothetical protein, partial [Oceanobacillus kimchii]|uniref:hypothetical protein n=1 Tax=Oceanobacillus kimchii TaxID=746691 RepID=UPI0023304F4D
IKLSIKVVFLVLQKSTSDFISFKKNEVFFFFRTGCFVQFSKSNFCVCRFLRQDIIYHVIRLMSTFF